MYIRFFGASLLCLACLGSLFSELPAQEPTSNQPPQQNTQNPNAPPASPQGIEVLARGPIHEAFATPTTEPVPGQPVPKTPPKPIEEMPPAEKPSGDSAWIGGYWAWDDDRHDFLWVSGIWRTPPPGKKWVAGYWKQDGQENRWVSGFWTNNTQGSERQAPQDQITYLPQPPAPPQTAPPGEAPNTESFYVPGHWEWRASGYQAIDGAQVFRAAGYAWVPGYWARVQPGYVWVAAHYTWSPTGYVYVPGYWDLSIANRGVIYAPVVIDPLVVGPGFVYTPAYIVRDTVVIDNLWIRPAFGHYYFGDYYGGVYAGIGFQSAIVFGRAHYDPIITYARYENRHVAGWDSVQINLVLARNSGRAPLPPRTLVQQNNFVVNNVTNVTNVTNVNKTVVNNNTVNNVQKTNNVLAPASQLSAVKGVSTTALSPSAQNQARSQAQSIQQVSQQRHAIEARQPISGSVQGPRTTAMSVPPVNPVTSRGVVPASTNAGKTYGSGGVNGANLNMAGKNGVPTGVAGPNGANLNMAGKNGVPTGAPVPNGTNPNMAGKNGPPGAQNTKMGQTRGAPSSYQKGQRKGPINNNKQRHPTLPETP
jgi:hypothetical protein